MKFSILRHISIMVMFLSLVACSGGGSGSSTSKVTIKIGAARSQKTVFAGMSSTSTTTYIPSVVKKITVAISAPDMTTISHTVQLSSGSAGVVLTFSVPNGMNRVIDVVAEDGHGNFPYRGGTTLSLSGVDVSVPVQMVENTLESIRARLYLYLKDTIEARGSALTAYDLEPFYSAVFGIDNGMTRSQYINEEIRSFTKDMQGKVMASLSISIYQPDPLVEKYLVSGKGYFSDGSYSFPEDGFCMIREGGEWKFVGNGYKSEAKLKGGSVRWIGSATPQPPYESGLLISVRDSGNFGINSALVSGPGLPSAGLPMYREPNSPSLSFSTAPYNGLPGSFELYTLDDAALASIPNSAVYTISMFDLGGTLVEQRSFVLPTRPWLRSELTPGHFPSLSIAPVSPATDGHYLADARIGGVLTMTLTQPAAFAASWLSSNLSYFGWGSGYNTGFWIDRELLLTAMSTTFSSTLPLLAINCSVQLIAEDFDRRRETRTYWLFYGPANNGVINFAAASNLPVTGGVTAPLTTDVWRYGAAAPTVSWSGFNSASMVDVYLLADDPQRLATPQTTGNPFPGVIWQKLNTTQIPAISGAFTLQGQPETLNVAGSGCRILVVSSLSGEWALSAPFTISP